jgi:hypothetical protein
MPEWQYKIFFGWALKFASADPILDVTGKKGPRPKAREHHD